MIAAENNLPAGPHLPDPPEWIGDFLVRRGTADN
jgi:hypothetical protein